jgi:transcriptional regulator with XRE-family HTH domain
MPQTNNKGMTEMEKQLRKDDSANSKVEKQTSTNSTWSRKALLRRLARGPEARAKFVESQISNGIAFQIRALRKRNQWSQPKLAKEIGTTQNQIYRLESPAKTKPTISTLKKLAAVFDVALDVRFVPFSQKIAWASGTPFTDRGLSTSSLSPLSFTDELELESLKEEKQTAESAYPETLPSMGTQLPLPLVPGNVEYINSSRYMKAGRSETPTPAPALGTNTSIQPIKLNQGERQYA